MTQYKLTILGSAARKVVQSMALPSVYDSESVLDEFREIDSVNIRQDRITLVWTVQDSPITRILVDALKERGWCLEVVSTIGV